MSMTVKDGKFDPALLDYVRRGTIKELQSFLRNDHLDLVDQEGKTLLHYAAESNNVSMTQHFINNNYDVDIPDNRDNSPLMLAVANDSFDTTKLLVEAGADIYMLDNIYASETLPYKLVIDLKYPALNKNHELVKSILKRLQKELHGNELLGYLQDFGCSLVQIMCIRNANMTRYMLENGYSVDERDLRTKGTALHEAVKLGDLDNVKVLLEFGASVGALDERQYPPLYYLYNRRLKFRVDDEARAKILKILIEHGALSSQSPKDPTTPTEFILEYGGSDAISALMQYDIDFNSYDSLCSLVYNANDDALEVMRGKYIDVNVLVANEPPLLSLAVLYRRLKKMEFLLERGADPNVVDDDNGKTPLIIAFTELNRYPQKKFLPIVRLLLQYGADVQYSYKQQTVFDQANNHEKVMEMVIAHLALIEDRGATISDLIRRKIDSQNIYKYHFQICKKQIEEMKKTTIIGSVTMYKLFTESQLKISRYARNPEFAPKFRGTMKRMKKTAINESFTLYKLLEKSRRKIFASTPNRQFVPFLEPYYSILLHKRVEKAIHETKLKEEAVIRMNKIFPNRFRNCLEIFAKISDDLTWDDLKNISKV